MGNYYRGFGIHVPARVMCYFAIFFPGYGSCFVNFCPPRVMGLLYEDLSVEKEKHIKPYPIDELKFLNKQLD